MDTKKLAQFISTVGNPLILSFLIVLYINFTQYPLEQAIKLTLILLVFVVLPIFLYIHYKVKKGEYADHDVSDRNKRKSLYVFTLIVLFILVMFLYYTEQPTMVFNGALFAWIFAFCSFVINHFFLKSSVHSGTVFLIAFMTYSINPYLFSATLLFAFVVAWSRVYLGRHTIQEVISGGVLGAVIGIAFQYFT